MTAIFPLPFHHSLVHRGTLYQKCTMKTTMQTYLLTPRTIYLSSSSLAAVNRMDTIYFVESYLFQMYAHMLFRPSFFSSANMKCIQKAITLSPRGKNSTRKCVINLSKQLKILSYNMQSIQTILFIFISLVSLMLGSVMFCSTPQLWGYVSCCVPQTARRPPDHPLVHAHRSGSTSDHWKREGHFVAIWCFAPLL